MELRKPVSWNILQLTGFLIPPTPQLHIIFTREKDPPGSLLDYIRVDINDTFRGEKREGSFVWPGAVIAGTEIWFDSRRAAKTGKAAPDFNFQPVVGEGYNQHSLMHYSTIWNTSLSIIRFKVMF